MQTLVAYCRWKQELNAITEGSNWFSYSQLLHALVLDKSYVLKMKVIDDITAISSGKS